MRHSRCASVSLSLKWGRQRAAVDWLCNGVCKGLTLSRGPGDTTTADANGPGLEEALGARGPHARTHLAGPRSPLLPAAGPRAPPPSTRTPRGVAGPRGPWRLPWPPWWSTRGSRPAPAAATATWRRARRPAVSVAVDAAGAVASRAVHLHCRRRPGPGPRGGAHRPKPPLPLSFPSRFFPDCFPSRPGSPPHRIWRSL